MVLEGYEFNIPLEGNFIEFKIMEEHEFKDKHEEDEEKSIPLEE